MAARGLLKRFTIAVTGDFGEQRTLEKIRQWICYHGGTFTWEISRKVTHLVCSKENYRKAVATVKQAIELKTVKIVSFDWLEDSLLSKPPRVRNEREYLMTSIIRTTAETKERKKLVRKQNITKGMQKFEKECKDLEQDVFSNGYHIYRDSTTFAYDITLARANLCTNKNQRYSLKIYETHNTPKLYACFTKYSAPGQSSMPEILAPLGSSFELAFGVFKQFFRLKTHKEWDDRLIKANMGEEAFVYTPPKEGEPKGQVLPFEVL
ncbi:MAG: hypothetical protein Q9164_004947 [Protoblastenia rupestris]